MRFAPIRDQKGEVMMGVMVVMMAVMMLFGGMHRGHGEHRSEGDHRQMEQKHGRDRDGTQQAHDHARGQAPDPGQEGPSN